MKPRDANQEKFERSWPGPVHSIDTDKIAAFIFDRYAENFRDEGRPGRMAFMVQKDGKEKMGGGLCEAALSAWIADAIRDQL